MLTFRAMNTDVSVIARTDEARVAHAVARTFAEAERRFSRFDPESELSRLNRAAGPMVVSEPMFTALLAARRHVRMTGGIFDPAIGATLAALGYDRSFGPGVLDRDTAAPPCTTSRFLELGLDGATREVTRPAGMQLDLGGMIKGRTVDAAATLLPPTGAIDAGGDAVVRGASWPIEIEDPRDPNRTIATVRVRDGAVATSAPNRRCWRVAGRPQHHLVDPRTQQAAATDLLQVTVVAPTAELADVLAKTVFVLGSVAGAAFMKTQPACGAVMITPTRTLTCGAVEVQS